MVSLKILGLLLVALLAVMSVFPTGPGNEDTAVYAGSPGCITPPSGLISWWPADGDAMDSVGGNHGSLMAGTGFGAGVAGQAFVLDGVDDYVQIGDAGNLRLTDEITLMAWVKPESVPPASGSDSFAYSVITKWNQTTGADSYALFLNEAAGGVGLLAGIGSPVSDGGLAGGVVPVKAWSHVAMTYDGVSASHRLYVDGQEVAQRSWPNGIQTSDVDVQIGREVASSPRYFHGLLDEIQVYDRVLAESEIQAQYASCAPDPPLTNAKLPYLQGQDIVWTGGPHKLVSTTSTVLMGSDEGSGLDFVCAEGLTPGIDCDSPDGAFKARSILPGKVIAVQKDPDDCNARGLGCFVAIQHADKTVAVYAHLDINQIYVAETSPSTNVLQGQPLAVADETGTGADNVHLHLELRKGNGPGDTCFGDSDCFGDPLSWDGMDIDGWRIHAYYQDGEGTVAYNYDGSAVKGIAVVVPDFTYNDFVGATPVARTAIARVGHGLRQRIGATKVQLRCC